MTGNNRVENVKCSDCEAICGNEFPELKCFSCWLEENDMTAGFEWVMQEIREG